MAPEQAPDPQELLPPVVIVSSPPGTGSRLDATLDQVLDLAGELAADADIVRDAEAELASDIDRVVEKFVELDREFTRGPGAGPSARVIDTRTDDELLALARAGNEAALCDLLNKYRAFARVKARSYFLVGADREDIVQEGMIGLYKAIRDFNPDLQTSFRAFAELCVTRQVITAIKTATRQKHGPLNNYVSFHRPVLGDEDGERVLGDVIPTVAVSDPADLVISAERIRLLQRHFDEVLSDLEAEVLRLYVDGKSYQQIAERLQRHVKSIDNALQRIKRKLDGHLRNREVADAG